MAELDAALAQQPCDDMPERPLAHRILTELAQDEALACDDDIDVEATLWWFAKLDGYCDCEVLYHVVGKHEMLLEWHANN